jgi:hypothetical protein
MRESAIPFKTEAGRLEIDQRKQKLGARHRMVLISINGERTVAGIRQQFAAINEIDTLLDELAAGGMIEVADTPETWSAPEVITAPTPELKAVAQVAAAPPAMPASALRAAPAAAPPASPGATAGSLKDARDYMCRILSAKLGLRAFLFNQKIEKSTTADALRELLPEFRRVLRKSVDAGRVAEFSAHVEELIGGN